MRFLENGPDLPSHLLEQQALGNVIFFCGAGVSMPAGLDSFWQLTSRIVSELDSGEAEDLLQSGEDFDRIFNLLVKRYGRAEIDKQIYVALGTTRARTLAHHRAILSLSKNSVGQTQLVTTNFDLLFERAGCRAPRIVPPNLPNLDVNRSLDGIVYLHGRLTDPIGALKANYIISSADFGRAYLAEAWAAKFVRELRERFTLVFLGYSADDPPMRYLLEGMHDREGITYSNPIYAFAANDVDDEAWVDRGVHPISYDPVDAHSQLWRSIHAWAEAASDPEAWIKKMVDQAKSGPRNLSPFQRGQIVELISSKRGAAAFANAEPTITAEWLCVFDPNARYAPARSVGWGEDAEEIDPHLLFGLDSDPPRPAKSENLLYRDDAKNPLTWESTDGEHFGQPTLQGTFQVFRNPLPSRLHHLATWFGKVCGAPSAIWWASGWKRISPHLLWFVARRLRDRQGGKLPDQAAEFWSYYLEHSDSYAFDEQEYRWFEFEGLVKSLGWTAHTLRYLERCLAPTVTAARPTIGPPLPPEGDWDALSIRNVVDLKVRVLDRHNTDLPIPDDVLSQVVQRVQRSLAQMCDLLDALGEGYWRPPNLHPVRKPGESYYGRKEQLVIWFSQLFMQLAKVDPDLARQEWRQWPKRDHRIFVKVSLWAASIDGVASNSEVVNLILSLSDEAFWISDNQSDLLLLMKQRWNAVTSKERRLLERRLVGGPPHWPYLDEEEYRLRKASHAASRLRWLELNDCTLSKAASKSLAELCLVDERFSDEWARSADESYGPRGGTIAEVKDAKGLETLPISQVIAEARRLSGENFDELRHYRPFRGLVEEKPFAALSALRRALRDGEFPTDFWNDLLGHWPKRTPLRLRLLLGHTIAGLSQDRALQLRYYSSDWLKKNLNVLHRVRTHEAFSIFDGIIRPFESAPPELTQSSVGNAQIGGEEQKESPASRMKVINSPVGHLTDALWSLTSKCNRTPEELSDALRMRFAKLCEIPGDGGQHAIAALHAKLGWIAYKFPAWANEYLLPMLDLSSPSSEAAWHGLVWNRNPLANEVWTQIRDSLLAIVCHDSGWEMGKEGRRYLIAAMVALSNPNWRGGAIYEFDEVRRVLKEIDDEERAQAVWELGNLWVDQASWSSFIKPFIEHAWPREKRFRSEQSTRAFLRLADKAGLDFPDLVMTIKGLLRPVAYADTFTYRLSKDQQNEGSHIKSHPLDAIVLLDAITGEDRVTIPFRLAETLEILGEIDPTIRQTPEFRRLRGLTD